MEAVVAVAPSSSCPTVDAGRQGEEGQHAEYMRASQRLFEPRK